MKSFFLILASVCLNSIVFSQFTDSFTDLDFTNSPTWSGDNVSWEVTAGGELHLNAPTVDSVKYLSLPSTAIDNGSWEFTFKVTVSTSSSNYSDVYLVSNTSDLRSGLNGYFVRLGKDGDEISLYKQTGATQTEIIDGTDGLLSLSSNLVKILVTRTPAGLWELSTDTTTGFTGYFSEGTMTDLTHTTSLYSGVFCKYTSTRSTQFYFDDFTVTGTAPVDNTSPSINTVTVTSSTTLDVLFSEPVDVTSAQSLTNYTVNNSIGNPSSAVRDGGNLALVHLTFSTAFTNGVYNNIDVSNVDDLSANTLTLQGKQFLYYIPSIPSYRDVVINEIIFDPTPSLGLPEQEFVELYNTTTNKIFDLSGWTISDGTGTATISSYVLLPNEYVIVCASSDLGDFLFYSNKTGTPSFPSLNNTSDELTLRDNVSVPLDYMNYDNSIFDGTGKSDGGWTIELVNPLLPCFNTGNWRASTNSNGGTPGIINSAYDTTPDVLAPSIVTVNVLSNSQIEVVFSESIDTSSVSLLNTTFTVGRTATNITNVANSFNSILIDVTPVLDTAIIYQLTLDSLMDCSGNMFSSSKNFVLANAPDSSDLIINEVLFDPFTGGFDFVEVYNNSDKYIDIYGWSISNDGIQGNLIDEHRVLAPGDYLVITEDVNNIRTEYLTNNPNAFVEGDLPTLSNDKGDVYLFYGLGKYSDWFSYTDDMHFSLLKDKEGVSLERLDFNRATNDAGNWHSAAENIGFATPGLQNSQFNPTQDGVGTLSSSPDIFSPDNDGFEDVLNINYELDNNGYVGNMVVYDANGRKTKVLMNNELLGLEGIVTWDGTNEEGFKARMGIYIIFFEVFNPAGDVKQFKTTTVLGHKL
jgi:hypothetical protein